jgi:hypothetical protein
MALVDAGKLDSARKELRRYDNSVLESNLPYGMTSNRGNFHNRVTMTYLYAAYRSGDQELAQKVGKSVKTDLEQQMKYYRSLGDEGSNNETMAISAANYMKDPNAPVMLSEKQLVFVQDIVSSYQMLMQMSDWEKQFGHGTGNGKGGVENAPAELKAADSQKAADTTKH